MHSLVRDVVFSCVNSNNFQYQNGRWVKKYRGMGSLEAMTKGSDQRYLGDTAKLKIAQGVVGAVADKGSVLKFVPYTIQAIKQGFQDLGASSLHSAHDLLRSSTLTLEVWFIYDILILFGIRIIWWSVMIKNIVVLCL